MRRGLFFCLMMFFVAAFFLSCSRSSHRTITLAGSTAFQAFAEMLAEKYLHTKKDVHINVQGGGSAVGIQSALYGIAEIGMADLLKLPPEAKDLNSIIVARDGIAIIVNTRNLVSSVTSEQAQGIFAGEIINWKDVGGTDSSINVISREDGSGTRKSFDQLVLKDKKVARGALFQDSNGTVREAVATDENAIGYISTSLVSEKVKALNFNDIKPTNKNIKKGLYQLARPVYFLTKGEPKQYVKDFIDYVLSDEAQNILEEEGLIGVK